MSEKVGMLAALHAPVGLGTVDAFLKMGVPEHILHELDTAPISWTSVVLLVVQFFGMYGVQIFSIINDIMKLLKGGVSNITAETVNALVSRDGPAVKRVIAGVLSSLGMTVPAFLEV